MKWRWYFWIPVSVGILFLILFITTSIQLLTSEELQWNNSGFENLFYHYSASIKLLSAAIITFTITFTIYRIDQTQQTLDNQDRQIKMGLAKDIRDDYNQRLVKHDDNKNFFTTFSFNFRDNYYKILPNADDGNRSINYEVEKWIKELEFDYQKINPKIEDNDLERYQFDTYSDNAKIIIVKFETLFVTRTTTIEQTYFEDGKGKFLSEADSGELFSTLNEIVGLAEILNKYFMMSYYHTNEFSRIKGYLTPLNTASNQCLGMTNSFTKEFDNLQSITTQQELNSYSAGHTFRRWKERSKGELRILTRKIEEFSDQIPMASKIIESLSSK